MKTENKAANFNSHMYKSLALFVEICRCKRFFNVLETPIDDSINKSEKTYKF